MPKSSIAMRTPNAERLRKVSKACSGCVIITLSVTSSQSCSGGICERIKASLTIATNLGSCNCREDTFTDIVASREQTPSLIQPRK